MKRGRKPGPQTLYTVWRNSDDRLMILDGTADQCAAVMGITKHSFYRLVCTKAYGDRWTIMKISSEQSKREEDS